MRKADNLPPSFAVVTKSENLNFLEPCGSFRACNGTAFTYQIFINTGCFLCGPMKEEVIGGWRKLNNVNLLSFYYIPNITRVIGEEGMKRANIMHGKQYKVTKFLIRKHKGEGHMDDVGVYGFEYCGSA